MSESPNEVTINATAVDFCCENGEPIEALETKLGELIEPMKAKDGPQEVRLTVIIKNDLELEDKESEDDDSSEEA